MAEENGKKEFYKFKIERTQTKEDRLKKLKGKVPFSHLLSILEIGDDDSEEQIISKLNAVISAIESNRIEELPERLKKLYDAKLTEEDSIKYEDYEHKRTTNPDEKEALDRDFSDVIAKMTDYKELAEETLGEGVEAGVFENQVHDLVHLPKSQLKDLCRFRKECEEARITGEFDALCAEFMNDPVYRPSYVGEEGKGSIKNEHRYSIKSGKVCHSILNLDGSGLNVTWIDGELGLTHSYDYLTPAQIEALAGYCYDKGIDIKDFGGLKQLKVKDGDKEVGSVADEFTKAIKRNNGERDIPDQKLTEDEKKGVAAAVSSYEQLSKYLDSGEEFKGPYDYLKDPSLDVKKSVMVSAAEVRSALMGNCRPELTTFKRRWNTTTISVYANENDKLVDGEYDKNGRVTRTKRFAVELTASTPPSARIYMGTDKEFTADHARVILDGFKKCGCKYFIVPPADQIGGKKAMGAWLKACVKAQVIPLCKTSKESEGMDLGAADLHGLKEAFDEEVKSQSITGEAKIEFMLRLAEQLERQEQYKSKNPKYQTPSGVQSKINYFKNGAVFENFKLSAMSQITDYIGERLKTKRGGNGESIPPDWDEADRAAAIYALGHVIKDLSNGKVNGKSVNPNSNSSGDFMEAFVFYQTMEKSKVVGTIFHSIDVYEKENNKPAAESHVNRAVSQERTNAEAFLKDICNQIQRDMEVELKPDISVTRPGFNPRDYGNDEMRRVSHHTDEYKQLANDVKEYGKHKDSSTSSGRKTETYREWKKRTPLASREKDDLYR